MSSEVIRFENFDAGESILRYCLQITHLCCLIPDLLPEFERCTRQWLLAEEVAV